jgi:hypothetical protein
MNNKSVYLLISQLELKWVNHIADHFSEMFSF